MSKVESLKQQFRRHHFSDVNFVVFFCFSLYNNFVHTRAAIISFKEHVTFAYNTIEYTFSNYMITPYGGLLISGQMLKAVDFDM